MEFHKIRQISVSIDNIQDSCDNSCISNYQRIDIWFLLHIADDFFWKTSNLLDYIFFFIGGEINSIEYNYDPRYLIEPVRENQSHYAPITTNEKYISFFCLFLLIICIFI